MDALNVSGNMAINLILNYATGSKLSLAPMQPEQILALREPGVDALNDILNDNASQLTPLQKYGFCFFAVNLTSVQVNQIPKKPEVKKKIKDEK